MLMAATSWTPQLSSAIGPIYLAIADALSDDIASGRLVAGARLPTQRRLADELGIDFTTVGRAYAEAKNRGLIEGKVGQGTYVRGRRSGAASKGPTGLVDMTMNLPPRFSNASILNNMWRVAAEIETGGMDLLMQYQEPGGILADREVAATSWLSQRLPDLSVERVLITAGAQGAFHAILNILAEPGDTICTEPLTYPGFRAVASHLRLNLLPIEMDGEGLVPGSFEHACRAARPKALYCMPTLHNPTTRTLPISRRKKLIEIARSFGVPIIEDDAYGHIALGAPPPLAALAPDIVYHVASLSKCLSPGLRVAYAAVPDARSSYRMASAVRASASIASPITSAIAARWIESGVAKSVAAEIVREATARSALASRILPGNVEVSGNGFHAWLNVPSPWTRGELISRLRSVGIGVVGSDAFAVGTPPEAVRLGLGAPKTVVDLERGLQIVTDLLSQQPAVSTLVV